MKTNHNISHFLPKAAQASCRLSNNENAQYLVFPSKRYVYIAYLTRIQGDCDKLWKIDGGTYLRYYSDVTASSKSKMDSDEIKKQVALRVAEEIEPTIHTHPVR